MEGILIAQMGDIISTAVKRMKNLILKTI